MVGQVRSDKVKVRRSPYDVSTSKGARLDSSPSSLPPLTTELPDMLKVSQLPQPMSTKEMDDLLFSSPLLQTTSFDLLNTSLGNLSDQHEDVTTAQSLPKVTSFDSLNTSIGSLPDKHGDDMTVHALFSAAKDCPYTLPPYQRPYNGSKLTITMALRAMKMVRIIMLPGISCYVENGSNMALDGQHRIVFLVVELAVLRVEAIRRGNLDLAGEITQVLNPGGNACYIPFDQDKWFVVDRCIHPSVKPSAIYTDDNTRNTLANSLKNVPECRFSNVLDVTMSDAAGMNDIELQNFANKILKAKCQRNMYENLTGTELLDIYRGMNAVVSEHGDWDMIKIDFVSRVCAEYNIVQLSNIWQFAESNLSMFEKAFKSGSVNGVDLNGFQAVFHFCTKLTGDKSDVGLEMDAFEKRLFDDAAGTIERFVRISRAAATFYSGGNVNTTGLVNEGLVEMVQNVISRHVSIAARDDYQLPAILLIVRLTKQLSDGANENDATEAFEGEMASLLEYRHLSVYTKTLLYDATIRKIISNIQDGKGVSCDKDMSREIAAMYTVCNGDLGTRPRIPEFRVAIHLAIMSQGLVEFKTISWRSEHRFARLYSRCNVASSTRKICVDNIIIIKEPEN